MEMQDKILINVPEAAKLLGLGKTFTYELIGQGQLPVVRLGKRVLIPVKHLNLYIETLIA
ncbi:MAG: helix-turn-helix domain-containing protein [Firmicutes bacterium]|jgi:excisionase family DNA binding protein|nr:helix-turn-helix domain-containing protein [Dethiobacter sp.]MCL4463850.1 helix-turn-helix domain-containing protein [Bacillota bacterium]MCL5993470.1 helix-turn-helix domain-containing protein [Bacillota bacterium]